jgi:NADH-quinone oxidoreductase subunit D
MNFIVRLKEIHMILHQNCIFIDRLYEIGIIDRDRCLHTSYSGIICRSTGYLIDGRLSFYECYKSIIFYIIIGLKGDCLDRYLCRINECYESLSIILQFIHRLPYFDLEYILHFDLDYILPFNDNNNNYNR